MRNQQIEIVNQRMDLVDYIYYLQYEMEKYDITVETDEAIFNVWDGSTFKVNGDEFTTDEFYEMLASKWKQVTCNSESFDYIGGKFVSVNTIAVKRVKYNSIIEF